MIDYIKGELAELTPAKAVVEAGGVGYEVNISLSTYSALENKQQVKVYVYEDIREDAWVLFGFATKGERELFLHLITVSGIGGNTARTILSSYSVAELCNIIVARQDGLLKKIKGIGGKTAQRIIVELEDKLQNSELLAAGGGNLFTAAAAPTKMTPAAEEALAGLTALGFAPAPTRKVVKQLIEKDNTLTAEAIIKQALKMM